MIRLRDELQRTGAISRLEYVGSAFKGTRVDQSDYDNLFVVRRRDVTGRQAANPQYAELRGSHGMRICPMMSREQFKTQLRQAVQKLNLAHRVTLAENGPAIELVCDHGKFSVDCDLCYEVRDGKGGYKLYIPKPPKTKGEQHLWKITTDLEEKQRISTIDMGNGVGRQAVRILKALKENEGNFGVFKSCLFEHILYHMKDRHKDLKYWRANNMASILSDMMAMLRDAVLEGSLYHYDIPSENLIPKMVKRRRANIINRLRRLSENPTLLQKYERF